MNYRIQPSAQAEADIDRIFNWLSERSPDGAAGWYESFWDATEPLVSPGRRKSQNEGPIQRGSTTVSTWGGI